MKALSGSLCIMGGLTSITDIMQVFHLAFCNYDNHLLTGNIIKLHFEILKDKLALEKNK